jgi:hypothetical protein
MDKYNIRTNNEIILNNKINETIKKMAENKLFLDDQAGLKEYLMAVYNGEIKPTEHKFYTEHENDFRMLKAIDVDLYYYVTTKKKKKKNKS